MFNFLVLKGYLVGATVGVDTLQNMAALFIISNRAWSMLMRKQTSVPHCQEINRVCVCGGGLRYSSVKVLVVWVRSLSMFFSLFANMLQRTFVI